MPIRVILFLALVASVTPAAAQQSGSIEAYRQRVRAQQETIDAEVSGNEFKRKRGLAKRITLQDGLGAALYHDGNCLNPMKLQDKEIGYLDCWVFQILDIAGPNELFLTKEDEPDFETICLKDYPTQGLVDGEDVSVRGLVQVAGTKTYTTVRGNEATIRAFRLLTPKESAEIEMMQALEHEESLFRTWTSKDGKHKVEAKFLKYEKGKVYLQGRKGKAITLSPNDLSSADNRHYRDLLKEQRLKKELGPLYEFAPPANVRGN